MSVKYRIVVEPDEDGLFVAECPVLPGCLAQGKTHAEAVRNIKDAIRGYVASLRKHHAPIPPPLEDDVAEVDA